MSEEITSRSRTQDILLSQLEVLREINQKQFGIDTVVMGTDYRYVAKSGDNSDGLTWDTAFNTINSAISNASSNAGNFTVIMIGPGDYNVNVPGDFLNIDKNIALVGVNRGFTRITNQASGAVGIIKFRAHGHIENITLLPPEFTIGLSFEGSGAIGSSAKSIDILAPQILYGNDHDPMLDGNSVGILCEEVDFVKTEDVRVYGEQGTTDAIRLLGARFCDFRKFTIKYCEWAIYAGSGDNWNHFEDFYISDGLCGVEFNSGAVENKMVNIKFIDSIFSNEKMSSNIIDGGQNNIFTNVETSPKNIQSIPEDVDGGAVLRTRNAVSDYGDWVTLSTIDYVHKLIRLRLANPSVTAVWKLQIGIGNPRRVTYEGIFSTTAGVSVDEVIDFSQITWLKHYTRVQARVMNDNVGIDSIEAYLIYEIA